MYIYIYIYIYIYMYIVYRLRRITLTHPITLILSLGWLSGGARHWIWRWKTTKRRRRQCCVRTVRRQR